MHFTGFPSRTGGLNFDFISPYFIIAEPRLKGVNEMSVSCSRWFGDIYNFMDVPLPHLLICCMSQRQTPTLYVDVRDSSITQLPKNIIYL